MILVLLGGAVVAIWGFAVGWIVETALSAAGLVIACAMIEPPGATDETRESASVSAGSTERQSIGGIDGPFHRAAAAAAAWLGGVAGAAAFFAQTSEWATTENATVLVAIVTLAVSARAFLARRLAASIRMQLGAGRCRHPGS